jgi:hypothetical protein
MISKSADAVDCYPLKGREFVEFKGNLLGMVPKSERFDKPHCLLEAILQDSAGGPGSTATALELAELAGIPDRDFDDSLEALIDLGIVCRFFGPNKTPGRLTLVFPHHPNARRVIEVLARRPRTVDANPELLDWESLLPSHDPEPDAATDPRAIIPFDEGLGRLFRLRDIRRGARSGQAADA